MSECGVVNRITAEGNPDLQPVPRHGHESTAQTNIYLSSSCFHVAVLFINQHLWVGATLGESAERLIGILALQMVVLNLWKGLFWQSVRYKALTLCTWCS